jgi:vacuolar-type H+-ATPase subunit I/STV1
MSDLLQEIKDYLDSIRHNAANAALAKNVNEYGVCVKIVSDCEEAVLSLFRKLDREYWELLERFGQLQAKAEKYENALREIDTHIRSTSEPVSYIIQTLKETLPEYTEQVLGDES